MCSFTFPPDQLKNKSSATVLFRTDRRFHYKIPTNDKIRDLTNMLNSAMFNEILL